MTANRLSRDFGRVKKNMPGAATAHATATVADASKPVCDATPDAIAIAKGIGGGFPIGALVTFGKAAELLAPGHHGTTFGGNPLATATANAVLGEIERAGLVENARARGEQLRAALLGMDSPFVTDVQGRGLLLGIGLAEPGAAAIVAGAQSRGLIINAASANRIRIAPPLVIGDAEIAEFIDIFTDTLAGYAHSTDGARA